jgi:hypothetical protein
MWLAENICH